MAPKQSSRPVTNATRAAAVVLALGKDRATEIYKRLNEEEIEKLSLEVARMEQMEAEKMQEIIDDFYGMCITQKVIIEDGMIFAKDVLEKAFGSSLAESYMSRISGAIQTRAFEFIRKANYKNLIMVLQSEHPQTIAFVLSYAKSEQASRVIAELPKDLQIDVIKRIATLSSVSPDIVEAVESILEKRFSTIISIDMTEIGGINYVAEIMNSTDRATEKYIFDELNRDDPDLSDSIRKLMFVFEDIVHLDDMSIQRVLRDVDSKQLAVAIKGSTEEVKETLLNNVSTRAKEAILEDIQYLRNVRMKEVEEAQQEIVNVIRTLEESGEIVVSRGGEEDAIIA